MSKPAMQTLAIDYTNARWYGPAIGRFIEADTIVPNASDPLSYDRYAYVRNNPLRYVDPSGHCEISYQNKQVSISKWDCTVDDFNALTWDQRILWTNLFMRESGVDWFYNIIGILEYFRDDSEFSTSDWALYADAGVLQAINDGWNLFVGRTANTNSDASEQWKEFFKAVAVDPDNTNAARRQWGIAEQAGVYYGVGLANALYGTSPRAERFTAVGNVYRFMVGNAAWVYIPIVQDFAITSQAIGFLQTSTTPTKAILVVSATYIGGYIADQALDPRTQFSGFFVKNFGRIFVSGFD